MPVQKFRSLSEMNAAPLRTNERDAFERFVRHCTRYRSFSRQRKHRGVFKFRSIEEAQAARANGD